MNKRTFNVLCRIQFGKRKKGEVDLTDAQKNGMIFFIVRNRGPVHKSLITPLLDLSWLHSCGYLYNDDKFLHTSETKLNV